MTLKLDFVKQFWGIENNKLQCVFLNGQITEPSDKILTTWSEWIMY